MKEYFKMSDVFPSEIYTDDESGSLIVDDEGIILESFSGDKVADYALHAINSHDELVDKVELLSDHIAKSQKSSDYLSLDGFIPNSFDAWGRPVKQYLPYDFSGNPGASATQYCNGWNDAGGYWINHAHELKAVSDELLSALEKMVAIHDDPSGFSGKYGKALDDAIMVQKEKIDESLALARSAITKAKGGEA